MDPVTIAALAGPLLAGIFSTAGQARANKQNIQLAREQMAFQERMSSTAAQRSRADYEAAGLNPYLAYDRTASSPGGSTTTIGDPISHGIASAQSATRLRAELALLAQQRQTTADQGYAAKQSGDKLAWEAKMAEQEFRQRTVTQPSDARLRAAEARLAELLLPGAENTAKFEEALGAAGKGVSTARTLSEILKNISGSRIQRK